MYEVEKIETESDFISIQGEWNDLMEHVKGPTIFLTWEMLYFVWKEYIYGNKDLLHILAIRDENGKLKGIAPFVIASYQTLGVFPLPVKEIRFLGTGLICSNYLDFIIHPGEEEAILKTIMAYLKSAQEAKRWDIINLTDLRHASFSLYYLSHLGKESGFMVKKTPISIHPFISLPTDWDVYLRSLSAKARTNIRYYTNRLEKRFRCQYIPIDHEENLEEIMNSLMTWLKLRWEHSPDHWKKFRNFHLKLARELTKKGWLQIDALLVDGRYIAISYGFKYAGNKYGYAIAFDPVWAKFSPGTVLLGKIIKQAISDGLREFDTLRLDKSTYKLKLGSEEEHIHRLLMTKSDFRGNLFYLYYLLEYQALKLGKNVLNDQTKAFILQKLRRIREKRTEML